MGTMNDNTLPHITFVLLDLVGGVTYMNQQIIEHSGLIKYFQVHVVLFKKEEDDLPRFKDKFSATSVEYFNYSVLENYYFVLKRLHKIIHRYPGIIVTNDGMEMQSIKLFGSSSLIYVIVHDFYNLKVVFACYELIDVLICHTETYARMLRSASTKSPRVDYLPHGVKVEGAIDQASSDNNETLKLIFIGRFIASKGVQLLYEINQQLQEKEIKVEWKIIGSGELESFVRDQWSRAGNVEFFKPADNEGVMRIARACDVFIGPSVYEGYGIALLEAMSCGLVPIVYELPVGISSLLVDDIGFRIKEEGIHSFVEKIELLNEDRDLLAKMKRNAHDFVSKNFDIERTSKNYLRSFLDTGSLQKKPKKVNSPTSFGIFDTKYLPNFITIILKRARNLIRVKL
jgi:glycosyltransferase involved in cell wall biosynthesis